MTTTSNTTDPVHALLVRIADALDRMAPPRIPTPDFEVADAFVWQTCLLYTSPSPRDS